MKVTPVNSRRFLLPQHLLSFIFIFADEKDINSHDAFITRPVLTAVSYNYI